MSKKYAAAASAVLALGLALGVGLPLAQAQEDRGTCNNYGDGAVVIAPLCGATFGPPQQTLVPPVPVPSTSPAATPTTRPGQHQPELPTSPPWSVTPTIDRGPFVPSPLL